MTRMISTLAGDERGNAFIEMALFLPILATLLVGTLDLSSAYANRLVLEQAAQRTVERIQRVDYNEDEKNTYKNEAATAADVAASAVTIDSWLECNGTVFAYDTSCAEGAVSARYVRVSIVKKHKPMFTKHVFPNRNPDGTVNLTAKAGIRVQ